MPKSGQRILHICRQDKFIPPFIELIEENFEYDDHTFWIKGKKSEIKLTNKVSIFYMENKIFEQLFGYFFLIFQMNKSEKIILHSLLSQKVMFLLFVMPWLLKKSYWFIWGSDLYAYTSRRNNFRRRIWEIVRYLVIRNMGNLVTYIPGDIELARQWYKSKGRYHECLMYKSNVVDHDTSKLTKINLKRQEGLRILIGNSGDPSNNHLEIFEILKNHAASVSKIITPLSYGKLSYIQKIKKHGYELFGEKFQPLDNLIEFGDYHKLLKSVDIAFFNHKRQQAMGTTITLLSLGKTIYIRPRTTHWEFLDRLGIKVKDINEAAQIKLLDETHRNINIEIANKYFKKTLLLTQLSNIFRF